MSGIKDIGGAGVSYVNELVYNNNLYVPSYALKNIEKKVLKNLRKQLPDYNIQMIPANA